MSKRVNVKIYGTVILPVVLCVGTHVSLCVWVCMCVCHIKGCTLLEGVQEYDADEDIGHKWERVTGRRRKFHEG